MIQVTFDSPITQTESNVSTNNNLQLSFEVGNTYEINLQILTNKAIKDKRLLYQERGAKILCRS